MKSACLRLALVVGLASPAAAQFVPTYSVYTRWVVNGTAGLSAANPATSFTLTLQGQAVFNGAFPADTATVRYGNYGIYSVGYGPAGPTAPSTIRRPFSPSGSTMERASWGTFTSTGDPTQDPPLSTVTYGPLRGASPGVFNPAGNGGAGSFRGGFRFFNGATTDVDLPVGNSTTPGDRSNGVFDSAGNMFGFNLVRDDFMSSVPQTRYATNGTNANEAAWLDLYRVVLNFSYATYLSPFGFAELAFNGFLRAGVSSTQVGSSWVMNSGDTVASTAVARFALPTPSSSLLFLAGGLFAQRRARRASGVTP